MADECNIAIATIQYYKEIYVEKYTPQQVISFAEELLAGRLNLGYSGLAAIRYNPHRLDQFNWKMNVSANANSFSLYLLGLRHVYLLARAFAFNQNTRYLELSDDFADSFYRYYTQDDELHGMTNNDHALAERIENLVFLISVARQADYRLKAGQHLMHLIDDAVNKLLGDKYYQRNHNHGIIVDKAALIGTYFLNKPDGSTRIEQIINRLKLQVEYAYYMDGVHKENSIDYHISVTAILWGCYYALQHIGHQYSDILLAYLERANEFTVYAHKPDNSRPLFGDSKGVAGRQRKGDGSFCKATGSVDIFGSDERLKFIASKGQTEGRPEHLSMFFPCGYVFFREHFNAGNYENATWMSFRAGYTTRVHKHRDDLSICLYSKGFDIFIDSGMCGYMPRDTFKDYMESVPAHTIIGIKNKDYSVASSNGEKFKMQKFSRGSAYDYAMASAKIYDSTSIYRHVYYLRQQDMIVIRDEIHSEKDQVYAQYFNLSNEVTPGLMSKEYFTLRIGDTRYTAVIKQLQDIDELNLLEGGRTNPFSYISTGFGSCDVSRTLEYLKRGSDLQFITVIEIKHDHEQEHEISLAPGKIVIYPEKIAIPTANVNEVRFKGVEISIRHKTLQIHNAHYSREDRFSLYVFTGDQIIKNPYKSSEIIQYAHSGCDDFVVMYYVANKTGERVKGILGKFHANEAGIQTEKIYKELHAPVVTQRYMEQTGDNHYRFVVDLRYDFEVLFSWWVYYNGSCVKFEHNSNCVFLYECVKPGEYVVMYSLRDRYFGEFDFAQFEKVVIE